MICSILGRKGFGHTIELQRQTLECMFGTIIPRITCRRMGYSTAGVFNFPSMQGISDVHMVAEGWEIFFVQ